MTGIQEFTQSLGFVVSFLILVLLLSMTVGDGPTTTFLWLVLISMALLNSQDIISLMGRFSTT